MRVVAMVVLVSTLGVPFGIAAEGYVCASGERMDASAMHACAACATRGLGLDASARRALAHRSIGRACCTYVASTALPQAVTAASASLVAAEACARAAQAPVVAVCPALALALDFAAPPLLAAARAPDPGEPGPLPASRSTDNLRL
jgi:hypothetical protein